MITKNCEIMHYKNWTARGFRSWKMFPWPGIGVPAWENQALDILVQQLELVTLAEARILGFDALVSYYTQREIALSRGSTRSSSVPDPVGSSIQHGTQLGCDTDAQTVSGSISQRVVARSLQELREVSSISKNAFSRITW
jgi:hypothetical protein